MSGVVNDPDAPHLFVKICGTTSEEDALLAVAMGADAVGFVFAPSPRQVTPDQVKEIVRRLPPEVMTVGVFRDEPAARVIEIVESAGLSAAQLHGDELPSTTAQVAERIGFTVKAFRAGSDAVEKAREHHAGAVLLDAEVPGSGQAFDWALVEGIDPGMKLILAGGLHPGNVAGAVRAVRPWGVDVVTGVESSPGRKDASKVRAFVDAARRMDRLLAEEASENEVAEASSVPGPRTPVAFDWEGEETREA